MGLLLYVSHPEVAIDPAVPVPDWGLSAKGRERAAAFAPHPLVAAAGRVVASREKKAIETAEILAAPQGLAVEIRDDLHENDRSATGFLPPEEFEATANRFFAEPETSIRGWERAIDAQRRIVGAVTAILAERPDIETTVMVGHGGVGTLLLCHAGGFAIDRRHDQASGGGNVLVIATDPLRLLAPWTRMEEFAATLPA